MSKSKARENEQTESVKPSLPKTLTGISGLDQITYGGIPTGRTTLICGDAGSGKTLMSLEFMIRGSMEYNEPGVFMAFEEKAKTCQPMLLLLDLT